MQTLFEYMLNEHGVTLLSSDMDEIENIVSKKQGTHEILKELERAETIHPFYPIDPFKQLAIMQEEAGEVTKAVLDWQYGKDTVKHVREELIQTAAMCMRMLKNLEQYPTDDSRRVDISENRINQFIQHWKNVICPYDENNQEHKAINAVIESLEMTCKNHFYGSYSKDDYVEVKSFLHKSNEYKEWTKVSRFLANGLFGVEIREIE